MRPLTIAGIVLLLLGSFIAFRGLNYRANRTVLKLGEFEANLEEQRTIPPWIGGIVILGGIALLVSGTRRSNS